MDEDGATHIFRFGMHGGSITSRSFSATFRAQLSSSFHYLRTSVPDSPTVTAGKSALSLGPKIQDVRCTCAHVLLRAGTREAWIAAR